MGYKESGVLLLSFLIPLGCATISSEKKSLHPDLSGVYFPIPPPGLFNADPAREGRELGVSYPKKAPVLTPKYMERWREISKSRKEGSYLTDYAAQCLPKGMPAMMLSIYGLEFMQTDNKITVYSAINDSYRRIYLDGRKPLQRHLDDPTYAGYSTGHWEGDTLIVDTVAIGAHTYVDSLGGSIPHSEQMTVRERIRLVEPTKLEVNITVTDPIAFEKNPYEITYPYRKMSAEDRKDELREAACPEGLAIEKYGSNWK